MASQGFIQHARSARRPRPLVAVALLAAVISAAGPARGQPTQVLPPGQTQPGGGDGSDGSTTPQNAPRNVPATAPAPAAPAPQPVTVTVEPVAEPVKNHDAAALAVLEEAERAIADLRSFRMTLTMTPRSWFKGTNAEGSAVIIGRRSAEDDTRWQIRITGSITPERASEAIDVDAVLDGNRIRYIDHANRVVGARIVPVRLAQPYYNVPANLWEHELWTRPNVFQEIRASETLTLEARQTIGGVECDVVKGVMPGGQQSFTAGIAVEDRLPRRMVEGFSVSLTPGAPPMSGDYTFDYTELEVNPSLSDTDFELATPEGYERQEFPVVNQVGDGVARPNTPKPLIEGNSDNSDASSAGSEEGGDEASISAPPTVAATSSGMQVPMGARGGAGLAVGSLAPEFELKNAAGETVRLADLRGQPVVLVFWGSWSPWARDLAGALEPVRAGSEGARFLALAVRERSPEASAQKFRATGFGGTLLPAADAVAAQYEVGAIPTVVVVDGQGRIVYRHAGFTAASSPVEEIRRRIAGE